MTASAPDAPYLELLGVAKHFGGVQALDSVSLTVRRGSVHALVGEGQFSAKEIEAFRKLLDEAEGRQRRGQSRSGKK